MEPTRSQPTGEISRDTTATSSSFTQLNVAIAHDRAELTREVLLWQRWLRYGAVVILVAVISLVSVLAGRGDVWLPALGAAGAYITFQVLLSSLLTVRAEDEAPPWLPWVATAADLTLVGALIYVSSTPAQYHRVLLLGFLVVQLAVFYFGRRLGVAAAAALAVGYIALSLLAPPYLDGPRATTSVLAFNTLLFLGVAAVVVRIFGAFHERMNRLRIYFKRAEAGDLAGTYDADADRRPDDLTLLGRGFNEMRARLIELIGTDPLTGCLNRRALETRLGREWRQAKRRGASLAVLAIDVDHFKLINDTFGHPAGDQVLQELGEVMRTTARDTDTVARLGGDEFIILLPDTGWQGAMIFAERLRRNVDEHHFGEGPTVVPLTISVGVALAHGTDLVAPEAILEAADRSLYKAKAEGRNRICA
ncbi:MAG TPA: GGDEF domain-containing protein [Gemmatimonadaceae bacterium]|nr:GGDEF domain-containing protein [Gemmatimonadaceae bacterium]